MNSEHSHATIETLSRYEQTLRNWRCVRRDMVQLHFRKLCFHVRGLMRAIFGV